MEIRRIANLLTGHHILKHCAKTGKVSAAREFEYHCHRVDAIVAQLFVDLHQIGEAIIPEVDFYKNNPKTNKLDTFKSCVSCATSCGQWILSVQKRVRRCLLHHVMDLCYPLDHDALNGALQVQIDLTATGFR